MNYVKSRMTKHEVAMSLFESHSICPVDAATLILSIIKECKEKNLTAFPKIKHIIALGKSRHKESQKSVSFSKAVALTLESKKHRRPRTLQEIKTVTNRIIRSFPELLTKKVRFIKTNECIKYIETVFPTPRQQFKARTILTGIFNTSIKLGFSAENPIQKISTPQIQEQEIHALSFQEINRLMATAGKQENKACLPAAAIMLYAGVRPREIERLTWQDISFKDMVIRIRSQHSKTGGARHVTIHSPLARILKKYKPEGITQPICPPNWLNRWKKLREEAGWSTENTPWQQDCLRHTFATYHAINFKDFSSLQWEMGHRSASLLRTRYVNMGSISRHHAQLFWKQAVLS